MWLLEQQCTFGAQSLWCCLHRGVLNRRRKERAKKDAGEILCYAFFLFLARHLTCPCKRQIQFRLLSCQSKLCYSFSLRLSCSPFASFPWMQSCEGRLHTFQTISSPPNTHTLSSLPEPSTCQHILQRALNRQQMLNIFTTQRKEGAHLQALV